LICFAWSRGWSGLTARIDALDSKVDVRCNALDSKIDRFREELATRMDALDSKVLFHQALTRFPDDAIVVSKRG